MVCIAVAHSPVILSYPDASIHEIKDGQLVPTPYHDCSAYRDLYAFLLNRKGCLQTLGLLPNNQPRLHCNLEMEK